MTRLAPSFGDVDPPALEALEPRLLLSASLPGLHLVDPAVDRFDGQVIYLDFDGAQDVDYNGPVTVEDIDVPVFAAPGSLAGQEQTIIFDVLTRLEATFADTGLRFVTEEPVAGSEYSIIYIGGNDARFAEYGTFPGLAEHVDVANQDFTDIAFVFSADFNESDASVLAERLSGTIAHEAGHILGYAHDETDIVDGLISVAGESGYIVSVSPSSFTPGQARTVTVRVRNTGDSDDMIIEYGSKPSGWSISPSYRNPYMTSGSYYDATFTVTPPSYASSGTIVWEFRDDDVLSNDLLDTWSQSVSASDTTAPSNPSSFSSSPSRNSWTTDNTISVSWSGASDNVALKGYYYVWSTSSSTSVGTSNSYTSTSSGSGSKTSPSLSDNSNWYFHIRYIDTSNNLASGTAHYGPFKIDRTAPSTPSLSSPSSGAHTTDTTPYFDWSNSSDSTSGVWKYQLIVETDTLGQNKINIETTSSYYQTPSSQALPAGGEGYDWRVRACDYAGNWGSWTSDRRLYVDDPPDTTPPSTPGTPDMSSSSDSGQYNYDNITNDNTPTFSWTGSSDSQSGLAGYEYKLGSGSWNWIGNTTSYTLPSLSDGNYALYVRSKDNANNYSSSSSGLSFQIDRTNPGLPAHSSPTNNGTVSTLQPTVSWSAPSDASGIWNYHVKVVESWFPYIDKVDKDVTGTSYTLSSSEALQWEETYTWRLYAVDKAGNTGSYTSEWRFTPHDSTAPGTPGTPDMSSSSDSGQYNYDNITNE